MILLKKEFWILVEKNGLLVKSSDLLRSVIQLSKDASYISTLHNSISDMQIYDLKS